MAKSQNQQVLEYMIEHGFIDSYRAVNELHVYRLSARIKNLKDAGVPIISVMKSEKTPEGDYKRWSEYSVDKSYDTGRT